MNTPRQIALRLLADKKGCFIAPASLERQFFQASGLEQTELIAALRELEAEGLVCSIYERLDGSLFALTAIGREIMTSEGCSFDEVNVASTRRLFEDALCSKPI